MATKDDADLAFAPFSQRSMADILQLGATRLGNQAADQGNMEAYYAWNRVWHAIDQARRLHHLPEEEASDE